MSLNNKSYFNSLSLILKKFNLDFLYLIPDVYKNNQRDDYKNNRFQNLLKNIFIFRKDYLIQDKKSYLNSKIIFLSHYVGNVYTDKDLDFYYGKLFKYLKKKKINFSVIVINHTKKTLNDISNEYSKSRISRIFVEPYSNPFNDIFNLFRIFKKYIIFKKKRKHLKFTKNEKIIINNKINLKTFINTRTNLRFNEKLIEILNQNKKKNKKMIVTFEGHSFERIMFRYCNDNKIISYGYFFSVIRKNKTSVFTNFQNKYMPNSILTTGPVIKNFFFKNFKQKKLSNIIDVGSTKVENRKKYKKKNNFLFNTILVCPEGFYSESKIMINFSKKIIQNFPNVKIIFRLHPVLDRNIIGSYIKKNNFKKNFKFSKDSLVNDLKKSNFILYRGSSISIKAALYGLIPINLKFKNEDTLDPLFEVNNNIVNDMKTLKILIDKYSSGNNKILNNYKKIQNYCLNYHTPLKLNKFTNILIK